MAVVWPSKNNFANGDVLTAANMNNIADTLNVFNPTSATNGQVWVANGSGSGAFSTPSLDSMTLLASGTFSSANFALGTTWSGYKQLRLICNGGSYTAGSVFGFRLNGISTTSYAWWYITPTAATTISNNVNQANYGLAAWNSSATFDSSVLDIHNCDVTNSPKLFVAYTGRDSASFQQSSFLIGTANISAAITSMSMVNPFGTSSATYRLFGIK